MKYLTQTTGALVLAGVAALMGGCGGSNIKDGAVLKYKADALPPTAADTSNLTMETAEAPVDPDLQKYVDKYEQANAKPAAKPAPVAAAKSAEPQLPPPAAAKEDIDAAKKRVAELRGTVKTAKNGAIIDLHVESPDTTVDDMKLFGRLTDLESIFFLGANFNDEYIAQLAGLKNLKSITVQNSDITGESLKLFATFPELTSLDVRRDLKLENADLEIIQTMPKLEKLAIYYNSFTNSGINKVAKATTLKVVDVRGCSDVSDNAAKYLAKLPNLEEVYFRFLITNDGVEKLSAAPNLKFVEFQDCNDLNVGCVESIKKMSSLTGLRLFRSKGIDDATIQGLADLKLTRLELRDLNLSNAGLTALKGMTTLETVEFAELGSVDEAGLTETLAGLTNLKDLDLFSTPTTDAVVKTIVATVPNLKTLSLRAVRISDAAIDEIVKLDSLETLDLRENAGLTVDGMMKLATMKNLRKIYVKGSALGASDDASKAKVAEFKKLNPKCALAN